MNGPQKRSILIITPRVKGGPWQWGAGLVQELNKTKEFKAKHIWSVKDKLFSPLAFGFKLIHTTNPLAFSFLAKPLVLTIHGKIHGGFFKLFYRLAVLRASAVTTPSEFLKNSLKIKNAVVIPNAVDVYNFDEVRLEERGFFNILTVTKFWFPDKSKGLFELAQLIFNLAKDFDKKINWRIIGYGPFIEDIKKSVTSLNKPENLSVQWFGFDTPKKYFSDSDIFAYFSYEDNMPIAIMEAMASGLSVVSNNVGAVSEIIDSGRDGFVAESHEDYQNILLKLMNSFALRKNIGAAAREKIKNKFSWETILPKWLEIYKSLLKSQFQNPNVK